MSRRPRPAAPGTSPALRGALLIFVAVLLGAGLLANGFRDDNAAPAAAKQTPTTKKGSATTAPGATATTASQPHDPAQVKVLVLNGSGKSGVAKAAADQLKAANYTALDPSNAKGGTVAASIVYFVAGFDADARAVAAKLGLPAGAAQALPTPLPATVADAQDANLVVVVGADAPIAAAAEAAPTTTATTAATPTTKAATTTTKAPN